MDITRGEMRDLLAKFSTENADYRAAIVNDPKKVIEAQFQLNVPEGVTLKVVEDSADTINIVLPAALADGELSDADLEAVAGGGIKMDDATCQSGMLNTVIAVEASLF